jgi:outer membrane receptor protein involved in Fe transport
MKQLSIFIFLSLIFQSYSHGQKGTLRGKIIDGSTGDPMIGATIQVDETTTGTITDFDGNYSLPLEPGKYKIKISFISYATKIFPDITIKANEVNVLNVTMEETTSELDEVVVKARSRKRTEAALQVMKKKSASLLDGISAENISKLGASDAAGALKSVTGVSVQEGKYVFVRGLSERYTIITLNNAVIPGLDPEKNTVQMDIFPSNIIENIVVHKTFSPDLPGVSTGGYINIVTKDFPEKFTLQFSSDFSYNSQSSLNDKFLTYEGGNTDWLGYDDGTRDMPDPMKKEISLMREQDIEQIVYQGIRNYNTNERYEAEDLNSLSKSFNSQFSPHTEKSFLDHSYKFSIGNQINLFGLPFGYNAALSYSHSNSFYDDGISGEYEFDVPSAIKIVNRTTGEKDTKITGMINTNLKLSNNHKLGFRFIKNQSGKSIAQIDDGNFYYEGPTVMMNQQKLGYLQRSFNSYQLHGKHVIPNLNKTTIKWLSSYTNMEQIEPDLRFFISLYEKENDTNNFYLKTNDRPVRYYREMKENNFDNKLDIEIPFVVSDKKIKFKTGGAYINKDRELQQHQFEHIIHNPVHNPRAYSGDIKYYIENQIVTREKLQTDSSFYYYYTNDPNNDLQNSYIGKQSVLSFYGMLDMPITDKFRIIGGARIENSYIYAANQLEEYENNFEEGEINQTDILPSLSAIYQLIENMNLRLAYSKTVARPSFKEIAPFGYFDYQLGFRINGEPDLEMSNIDNIDLRWEYYFNPGEMISISGFYKNIDKPIELIQDVEAGNTEIILGNAPNATLTGLEIEAVKKLSFVSFLKDFTLGGNFTLVDSKVEIPDSVIGIRRITDPEAKDTRPLQGQAPFIINLFLGYENETSRTSANLNFNTTGSKLFLVTKPNGATPYIYEEPFPSLNFNISKGFGKNINVEFSVKNIFNSIYSTKYDYDIKDEDFYLLRYSIGRTYGLSLSYIID